MSTTVMPLLPNHSPRIYRPLIYGNPFPDTRMRFRQLQRRLCVVLVVDLFCLLTTTHERRGSFVTSSEWFSRSLRPTRKSLESFSPCHRALGRAAIPKFSAKNLVNVTLCQNYPFPLEDLTLTEEYAIARCHPLGLIVKLRPSGRLSSISHRALRGHFIVIPQDPGPLLRILTSPDLGLDNLIRVFWVGSRPPSEADLRPYLAIRKHKVLAALQYLVRHNSLYHGLTINEPMMDNCSGEFIPPGNGQGPDNKSSDRRERSARTTVSHTNVNAGGGGRDKKPPVGYVGNPICTVDK